MVALELARGGEIVVGERFGHVESVADLSSVEIQSRKVVQGVFDRVPRVISDLDRVAGDEVGPDLAADGSVKRLIVKGDLNATLEGVVHGAYAVGCEEQNTALQNVSNVTQELAELLQSYHSIRVV